MMKSRQKCLAIALLLLTYTVAGVLWLYPWPSETPPTDKELLAAFYDSLQADSARWQQQHKRVQRDWQAEREARRRHTTDSINRLKATEAAQRAQRDSLRAHRRDSAQHYWDSVRTAQQTARAQRDSAKAVRDSLRLYININKSSAHTLRSHPYISGEQTEAILQARQKYRRIEGWHQLLRLSVFTETDSVRLAPFIVF